MQEKSCARFAEHNLFGTKRGGTYAWTKYGAFAKDVDAFRAALDRLGVQRGDKVGVIANNRVEWAVAAYATYGLGAHYVPMYEAQHAEEWAYILKDSGVKVLLASTEEIRERAADVAKPIRAVEHVIGLESPPDAAHSFARLLEEGRYRDVPSVKPALDETAGLIYTSGTTGNPKGVVLSHGNIVSNINAVDQVFPLEGDDVSCSFLPWAHSFGQTCELHVLLSRGAGIGIAESVQTLMEDLQLVRPTVLYAVPRVFNRIYDGLNKRLENESPRKRQLFARGLEVAARRRALQEKGDRSLWLEAQYAVFDRLVFSGIKQRFGGRLRYVISGGAALSKEVAEFIDNVGILVFEGYGLTETSPIVSTNTPDARKLGTVGRPIPGVDVFICDEDQKVLPPNTDGEVVVVGPNVMQGYYGLDTETDAVIFELDGMRALRTGDMGRRTSDGYLKITGRFKEQYKLENGKYVVPTVLEEQLKLSGLISQAFIYGDNKPFNVCLVIPDAAALEKWAKAEGITGELTTHDRVHAKIGEELERYGAGFKGFERPKKWAVIDEEFSVENGLLTPKLSIKRRNVVKRYRDALDALYTP